MSVGVIRGCHFIGRKSVRTAVRELHTHRLLPVPPRVGTSNREPRTAILPLCCSSPAAILVASSSSMVDTHSAFPDVG